MAFVRKPPAAEGAAPVEKLLDAANAACKDARSVWLGYLLLGACLLVTVGATTHKQLLLDAPIKLPLLDVEPPLRQDGGCGPAGPRLRGRQGLD